MEKTLSQRFKEECPSAYKKAAILFNTSLGYVSQIATGVRSGSRGKGKLIKEYLEQRLKSK